MEYINLGEIRHTQVSEELVLLSGKHVNVVTSYKAPEDGSPRGVVFIDGKSDETSVGAFWEEFDRLQRLVTKALDEPILSDDYPLIQGYLYVTNRHQIRQFIDGERMTVGLWKKLRIEGVSPVDEVRRCDIVGRQLRLPLKKVEETTMSIAMNTSSGNKGTSRKKKKTYKIKKVV
jgi:hypothetical protein